MILVICHFFLTFIISSKSEFRSTNHLLFHNVYIAHNIISVCIVIGDFHALRRFSDFDIHFIGRQNKVEIGSFPEVGHSHTTTD